MGDEEKAACRGLVIQAMEAMNVAYVLVVGRGGLKVIRPDLEFDRVVRSTSWFVWKDRWLCKAVWGADEVMTGKVSKKLWLEEIDQFKRGVELGVGVEVLGSGGCAKCGSTGLVLLDENGFGWCLGHQHIGMASGREAEKYWQRVKTQRQEGQRVQQQVELEQLGLWD